MLCCSWCEPPLEGHSYRMAMTSTKPCMMAVNTYTPQELQPPQPRRAARLPANRNPPGVWMHIIRMLRLPACLRLYVVQICGMYWTAASAAEVIPRKFAQALRCDGAPSESAVETTTTTRPWIRQMPATLIAVRHVGWSGSFSSSSSSETSASSLLKKTRNRTRLYIYISHCQHRHTLSYIYRVTYVGPRIEG